MDTLIIVVTTYLMIGAVFAYIAAQRTVSTFSNTVLWVFAWPLPVLVFLALKFLDGIDWIYKKLG